MSKGADYRKFIKSVRSTLGYWKSYSLLQFTTSLTRLMRSEKVSGKELATRLGVSAAQVSKVLGGNENVTIETMAKFADAIDAVVHIYVAKKGVQVQPVEQQATAAISSPLLGYGSTLNISKEYPLFAPQLETMGRGAEQEAPGSYSILVAPRRQGGGVPRPSSRSLLNNPKSFLRPIDVLNQSEGPNQ